RRSAVPLFVHHFAGGIGAGQVPFFLAWDLGARRGPESEAGGPVGDRLGAERASRVKEVNVAGLADGVRERHVAVADAIVPVDIAAVAVGAIEESLAEEGLVGRDEPR